VGDLVNLRRMEQALEQIRALPGGDAKADLAPGDVPGESILQIKVKSPRPVSAQVSVNNLGGATIGNWSGSGQISANNLLGRNESLAVNVNNRLFEPAMPANSTGSGISLTVPSGYWTLGVSASQSHYRQEVVGSVATFTTSNVLNTIAASLDRVIVRDSTSKTDLQLRIQRRWGRSYIDGVEIALQHQDLTDIALSLNDRRRFGEARLDSSLSFRQGIGLLGAQADQPGLPQSLPSAHYSIASLDLALTAPLTKRLTWHSALRAQYSPRALFGPDVISAGGPYTVRGYAGDHAIIGQSGFYWRNELGFALNPHLQPYALLDGGHVYATHYAPIGAGAGLRANLKWFSLDGFAALPLGNRSGLNQRHAQFGLTLGASI
jgi:hemolysin activation/secretion protein